MTVAAHINMLVGAVHAPNRSPPMVLNKSCYSFAGGILFLVRKGKIQDPTVIQRLSLYIERGYNEYPTLPVLNKKLIFSQCSECKLLLSIGTHQEPSRWIAVARRRCIGFYRMMIR